MHGPHSPRWTLLLRISKSSTEPGLSTTRPRERTVPDSQGESAGPLLLRKGHCCRLKHVPYHTKIHRLKSLIPQCNHMSIHKAFKGHTYAQSCLTLCNFTDCSPPGSSVHGDFPGKNTGVGCHFLLQEIFPTQGSNPGPLCLQYWQAGSLPLGPPGKPFKDVIKVQ